MNAKALVQGQLQLLVFCLSISLNLGLDLNLEKFFRNNIQLIINATSILIMHAPLCQD